MKKSLSIVLAAMMAVSLAGCGGGSTAATTAAPAATEAATTAAPAAESAAVESGAQEETRAEESQASSGSSAEVPGNPDNSTWPSGSVSLYVPAAAGGGTDMMARVFAQAMTKETGANFVVVNDATGGGTVVAETVRNAKPDGLTLMLGNTGICGTIATGQYKQTLDDFAIIAPVTVPGKETNAICVNASSDFQTLDDFVNYAKENPEKLLVGVQTNGNRHFMQALLEKNAGISCTKVDCGGVADTITNLVGGMIDMAVLPIANASQYVESGDMRALCITGDYESDKLAGVPTMASLGYESCNIPNMGFLIGPKTLTEDDIAKMSQAIKNVVESPEYIENIEKLSMECGYLTPAETADLLHSHQELYNSALPNMQ